MADISEWYITFSPAHYALLLGDGSDDWRRMMDNMAARERPPQRFEPGERVTKIKGSSWTGKVVGFYSTKLTPSGYAVESENEPGSVQIYPETALASLWFEKLTPKQEQADD